MGAPDYRDLVDSLVLSCCEGQCQIGPRRVRSGSWNENAEAVDDEGEQERINDLLRRMTPADREVLGRLLDDTFASGVHEALVVLHERRVPSFEQGEEGSPAMDFSGRRLGIDWASA